MNSITKVCCVCGIEKDLLEFPARGRCYECKKKYDKEWRESHKSSISLSGKKYRDLHKEEIAERWKKEYYENNGKEKARLLAQKYSKTIQYYLYQTKYRKENKAKINTRANKNRANKLEFYKEKARVWREAHKEKIREYFQKWRKSDPEHVSIIERNIRHKRRSSIKGSFSKQEWLDLCSKYDNLCLRCGQKKPLTIDHVVPISKGGLNVIENIQPLCKNCNCAKRDKTIDYRNK